ncbi:MAG: hypothetical protein C4332_06320 [Meiothermus sp.]
MPNKKGTRKKKGEGNIRRRADGLLEARVTLGWKDGKCLQKSVYAKTEEEIVARKNKLLAAYGLGVALADKATVEKMLLEWLEYKGTVAHHPRLVHLPGQQAHPPHFHDLRHTNITLDLAMGGDFKTASQRAGHSTVTFTANVYQHPNLEQHLEATSRMVDILAPTQRDPNSRPI